MKKYIKNSIIIASCALVFSACDDNAWNDKLDGFEENGYTDVKTIEYTLTDADYSAIASNSVNQALAGEDKAAALKAVGTNKYFSPEITAREYVPAFLDSNKFPYFTLDNGSAVKLTYKTSADMPEEIAQIAGADSYEVTEDDYKFIWGDEEKYVESFAPSKPAAQGVVKILNDQFPDAEEGDTYIVTYKTSAQEPVFGSSEPQPEEFKMSEVIGGLSKGDNAEISGVITALCTRGYILTDKSGSILVYVGTSFDAKSHPIGSQVKVAGAISSFNLGLQVDGSSMTEQIVGSQSYTYPSAPVYSSDDIAAANSRTTDEAAVYCQFTGKTKISGSYINVEFDDNESVQGSIYYPTEEIKAKLADGEVQTFTGYFTAISSKGKYFNLVATDVKTASMNSPKGAPRAASVVVPTTVENCVCRFDGKTWRLQSKFQCLNPDDYAAMGQSYGNLSAPDTYLPTYLKVTHPYAQADDAQLVVYRYYSSGSTVWRCDEYIFDGSEWKLYNGVVEEVAQFVRTNGHWMYDPNVTINLPAIRNDEFITAFYQACTNWVFENIDKPLGSTDIKSGMYYVTSYGNNEYYAGTSAYYNNVDLRAAKARDQYPAGYEGMTDEEVVALMKSRCANEVMPGALAALYPDAVPVEGLDVIYTLNFVVFDGASSNHTIRFKVTAPGTFTFLDCTWDTPAE